MRASIVAFCSSSCSALLAAPQRAFAQGGDLTLFVGSAYPVDHDRFTLRPSTPSLPGADITVNGTPELKAAGGLVVGGALAFELGVLGIEGRWDSMSLGFDVTGAPLRHPRHQRAAPGPHRRRHRRRRPARRQTPEHPLDQRAAAHAGTGRHLRVGRPSDPAGCDHRRHGAARRGAARRPGRRPRPRLRLDIAPGESNAALRPERRRRPADRRQPRRARRRSPRLLLQGLRPAIRGRGCARRSPPICIDRIEPVRFDPIIVNAQAGLAIRF